jgi:phosphomannomutase
VLINKTLLNHIGKHYDIRSEYLSEEDAFLIGKGFASIVHRTNGKTIVIGHDRRKMANRLYEKCIEGMLSCGINVIAIGQTSTPVVQLAEIEYQADACISVTASHNFSDYEGFKFFKQKKPFALEQLSELIQKILDKDFIQTDKKTEMITVDFHEQYVKILQKHLSPLTGVFDIAWDFLNGTCADVFPYIAHLIPGAHYAINFELDHKFSGNAPDPSCALQSVRLKKIIEENDLDFGIVFDGDGDRMAVISKTFQLISGDKILALFAYIENIIKNKNIITIWDIKSSRSIINWCKKFSTSHIALTGTPNVYNAIKQYDADMAGECSGHYFFKDFFYISDGIFSALKLIVGLEHLSKIHNKKVSLTEALNLLPQTWHIKERKIPCEECDKMHFMILAYNYIKKRVDLIDVQHDSVMNGFIVQHHQGWWIMRPSNTEGVIRISGEVWIKENLEEIEAIIQELLDHVYLISRL